jgi:hypothetical protein
MAFGPMIKDRECGDCRSCCVLFAIRELEKPAGRACVNLRTQGGCKIYTDRPSACRVFYCGFMTWQEVPRDWRPDQTGFVVGGRLERGTFLSITVEPDRPDIWRSEPYYGKIKEWSVRAVTLGSHVAVFKGARAVIVRPDQDIDLGVIGPDEVIVADHRGQVKKVKR